MIITAKDVGRWAANAAGEKWKIEAFRNDDEWTVIAARDGYAWGVFRTDGIGRRFPNLILFADEPDAKPPETVEVQYDLQGFPLVLFDGAIAPHERSDLAGRTFTYKLVTP
jgi:hypothetical protein